MTIILQSHDHHMKIYVANIDKLCSTQKATHTHRHVYHEYVRTYHIYSHTIGVLMYVLLHSGNYRWELYYLGNSWKIQFDGFYYGD